MRVLVAEEHPLYRDALARMVEARAGLELVAQAADAREALAAIGELKPDVALLAYHLPGIGGAAIVAAMVHDNSPARVLFISADVSSASVLGAISAGAYGYVPKSWDEEQICEAIQAVSRGEVVVPPDLQPGLLAELRRTRMISELGVSGRELEVLALAAGGSTASDSAKRLDVSEATIRAHLHHVYEKLGVSDRAAAVAMALRKGLID